MSALWGIFGVTLLYLPLVTASCKSANIAPYNLWPRATVGGFPA